MITNESVKFDSKGQRPRGKRPPLGKVYKKPNDIVLVGMGLVGRPVHYGKFDPSVFDYSPYYVLDLYNLYCPVCRILRQVNAGGVLVEYVDPVDGYDYTKTLPWDRVVFVEPCE